MSATTHNDIIEISCTIDSNQSVTAGDSKVEMIGSGTMVGYLAKNKGTISTVTDICGHKKTNGTKTRTCNKTTEEIITR